MKLSAISPLDKLASMKGKQWMYKTRNVEILAFKQEGGKVYIVTDKEWIISSEEDLNNLLQQFLEVEKENKAMETQKGVELPDRTNMPDSKDKMIVARKAEEKKQVEIHQNTALQVVEETRADMEQMRQVLMDNIKKIQQDKAYIEQAKAINNNVNTIINMVKLEFLVTKELKRK